MRLWMLALGAAAAAAAPLRVVTLDPGHFHAALIQKEALAAVAAAAAPLRIVTLDPGHFHAALIQKEALSELAEEAWVYAPLGPDLTAHLNRVAAFNARKENPTHWKLHVYAAPDYWEKLLASPPGEVLVLSGASRGKIGRLSQLIARRRHVLGDKPWIIEPEDLGALDAALTDAARRRVAAFDGMTQRFEISCLLQRELVNEKAVFGEPLAGTQENPGVYMESVHYLLKMVAGAPNLRPAWFFDVRQQGEGLTDVGTHLVDLVFWILFPEQAIDHRREVQVLAGSHWPTRLNLTNFQRVTGTKEYPEYLQPLVKDGALEYFCNNRVDFRLRGVHVRLDVKWDFEAPPGLGDTELAIFRGTRSAIEVRQGKEENFKPEVYVVPNRAEDKPAVASALRAWQRGLPFDDLGARFRLRIPEKERIGHEAHFALLVQRFLQYVRQPASLPAWEKPNMLAKYYITTRGVELARQGAKP
jgi:predicted dehydrogenase